MSDERLKDYLPLFLEVPPEGVELDDDAGIDEDECLWVSIQKATPRDLARYIQLKKRGIEEKTKELEQEAKELWAVETLLAFVQPIVPEDESFAPILRQITEQQQAAAQKKAAE